MTNKTENYVQPAADQSANACRALHDAVARAAQGLKDAIDAFWNLAINDVGGRELTVIDHLTKLAARRSNYDGPLVDDIAWDLMVDAFSHLPEVLESAAGRSGRGTRVDCRWYFRALYRRLSKVRRRLHAAGVEELANAMRRTVRRFLNRQYIRSRKEAKRRESTSSRYALTDHGKSFEVYVPRDLYGLKRRQRMTQIAASVDPTVADARAQIQQLVDQQIGTRQVHSLDDKVAAGLAVNQLLPWPLEYGLSVEGLIETTRQEKEAMSPFLPPSFQKLGREKRWNLITEVLEILATGQPLELSKLAAKYAMNKVSLWRLCNNMAWDEDGEPHVPLLYRNIASLLAQYRPWVEAAKAAGVWDRVDDIVGTQNAESDPAQGLFFMTELIPAVAGPDATGRLRLALASILARREDPAYRQGYRNFLRFVAASHTAANAGTTSGPASSATVPPTDNFGSLTGRIGTVDAASCTLPSPLYLFHERHLCFTIDMPVLGARYFWRPAMPGRYMLTDSLGHAIWTAELQPRHLVWRHAFSGQRLRLAAATHSCGSVGHTTVTVELLGGAIKVRVFPGLESGQVEILVLADPTGRRQ
jgi:hypothetical protein